MAAEKNGKRARNWCVTLNNPDDVFTPLEWVGDEDFVAWQLEKGEKKETPHLQIYMEFKNARTLNQLKKKSKTAHWEIRKGTQQQALDYATKWEDPTYVDGPWCYGDKAEQGARHDIAGLVAMVKEGCTDMEMAENVGTREVYFKYHAAVTKLRGQMVTRRTTMPEVRWYYGPTGTGKSTCAITEFPDAYVKNMSNGKWWDGYRGQTCVLLDDMRKDTFKFHELLRLFDRLPLQVEYKGGSTEFNSPVIIVTSCYAPEFLYETREDLKQLLRRIAVIREFSDTDVLDTEVGEGNTMPHQL